MKIYTSISLAIFASVCFLIGFFSGEWVTEDKIIKGMTTVYNEQNLYSSEAIAFMYEVNLLSTLIRSKEIEDIDSYINLKKKDLSNKINQIEGKFETYPYHVREYIYKPSITEAKNIINERTLSN